VFKFDAKHFANLSEELANSNSMTVAEKEEEMSVKQLFEFMMAAEKRREMDTEALSEKLGAIQISQQEMAVTWKPNVNQALGNLSGAIEALQQRVDHMDTRLTTTVAGTCHGAVEIQTTGCWVRCK
jgi:hypothetical protein